MCSAWTEPGPKSTDASAGRVNGPTSTKADASPRVLTARTL